MYELSARHLPYLQQTILQGCFTLFYSLRHCASLTLLSGLLSQTGMSWSQGANDLLMILQRYNSIYTQTVLAKGTDIYKRSRRASFSWLNHQIEHSYSTQPSQPARKPKPGTVVLLTSPPSLTMLWNRTTSSTGTVQKWSPGRHSDKPDGSKRHFGLGRPRHASMGMQDPTNSATHGT